MVLIPERKKTSKVLEKKKKNAELHKKNMYYCEVVSIIFFNIAANIFGTFIKKYILISPHSLPSSH